jgi:hypothetical protein
MLPYNKKKLTRDTDLRRLRGIPTEEQRWPARSRFLYQRSEHLEKLSALSSFVVVVVVVV